MIAVGKLRENNFNIWLENGKIRYKQCAGIKDKSKINSLLQEIKKNKNECILLLLYEAEFEKINLLYQAGGLEYIEEHYPGLYIAIERAKKELNKVWDRCADDVGTIEDFKRALSKWANLNIKGIVHFKSKPPGKTYSLSVLGWGSIKMRIEALRSLICFNCHIVV